MAGGSSTPGRPNGAPRTQKLSPSVEEALKYATLQPEDAAVADLARSYARTIDNAAAIAERAAKIPFDPDTAEEVAKLRARVSAHATMADLGPKLLAALESLGVTPKARAAAGKPRGKAGPSKLQGLRGGAA